MYVISSRPGRPSPDRPWRRRFPLALSPVVLALVVMACGEDNPVNVIPGAKYLTPSSPQSVLFNLKQSYTSRDSVAYDSLFDAFYQGASLDQGAPGGPQILNFTKVDEAQHIAALARTTTIRSITLDFGSSLIRYSDGADPPGWATIQIADPHLEIDDTERFTTIQPNETMRFKFVPTTPAPGSPTDTTWKIIRWEEVAPLGP